MFSMNPASPSWPAARSGNVTGVSVATDAMETICFQFTVDTAGATPTVTFKWQATPDGTNWYDVMYVTDASDTGATAGRTVTATGTYIQWLSNPVARRYKAYRLVTSANTNVTWHGELYQILSN